MTDDPNKSRGPRLNHARSNGWQFGLRLLFIAILAISMMLASWRYAVRRVEEWHARSCLRTIGELADRTISESISQGNYGEAIAAAKYIRVYYPVGAVLPHDHPFAFEYEAERKRHLERIRSAISSAVGGVNANEWEKKWEAIERP